MLPLASTSSAELHRTVRLGAEVQDALLIAALGDDEIFLLQVGTNRPLRSFTTAVTETTSTEDRNFGALLRVALSAYAAAQESLLPR